MELQIVIAGRGGEGIILMTMILAEGFYQQGYPVLSTETHGMAMRGGSVISQLKVGDFQSPMISYGQADLLIATSEKEAERNRIYLKEKGGKAIVDSTRNEPYSVDARRIAQQLGSPRTANIVLLGYTIARLVKFESKMFEEAIFSLSPESFSVVNEVAFKKGFQKGILQNHIRGGR